MSDEDIDAKLWQDPFQAVEAALGKEPTVMSKPNSDSCSFINGNDPILPCVAQKLRTPLDTREPRVDLNHMIFGLARSIFRRVKTQHAESFAGPGLLIMPVMVPGGPYAQEAESRRRQRHAVISALMTQGYSPENSGKLGYIGTRWSHDSRLTSPRGINVPVPFEWFSANSDTDSRAKSVLVLWLDDGVFADFKRIRLLLGYLTGYQCAEGQPCFGQSGEINKQSIELALIGPGGSTSLIHMLNTIDDDPEDLGAVNEPLADNETKKANSVTACLANKDIDPNAMPNAMHSSWDAETIIGQLMQCRQSGEWVTNKAHMLLGRVSLDSSVRERLVIYSSRSTIGDDYLAALLGKPRKQPAIESDNPVPGCDMTQQILNDRRKRDPGSKNEAKRPLCGSPEFHQVLATDDELANELVEELKLRNLDICKGENGAEDHVALIGEVDSEYARFLPASLIEAIKKCRNESSKPDGAVEKTELFPTVHGVRRFGYLQGIDGRTAGQLETKAQQTQPDSDSMGSMQSLSGTDLAKLERPYGSSQLDYMRRLAEQILKSHKRLREQGQNGIRAVGVVGSDVYDKQLILQALRAVLPEAVFFTTDLDSRLLHPSEFRWNRNLIIASSYGLSLSEPFQKEIPPFRDTYETSTYMAVLLATQKASVGNLIENEFETTDEQYSFITQESSEGKATFENVDSWFRVPKPRRFEIGRGGPVDITAPASFDEQGHPLYSTVDVLVHGPMGTAFPKEQAYRVWKIFFAGLLLLLPFLPGVWGYLQVLVEKHKTELFIVTVLFALTIALTLLFQWLIHLDQQSGMGEPFLVFQGVSVWPSEIIRFSSFILGIWLLVIGVQKIMASNDEFMERYDLKVISHQGSLFSRLMIAAWNPSGEERPDDLVEQYLCRGQWHLRLLRILPFVLIFIIFAYQLFELYGRPLAPARGIIAEYDGWILQPTVILMLFLTFAVTDTSRLCRQFIKNLIGLMERCSDGVSGLGWKDTRFKKMIAKRYGVSVPDADYVLTIDLIANRTEVLGPILLYPFIILFLLIVSRNSYFDNWSWPFPLLIIYSALASYAIINAYVLRRIAEKARDLVLLRLKERQTQCLATDEAEKHPGTNQTTAKQVAMFIDHVENISEGAFMAWFRQPLLKAILIPVGGVGTVMLLEILATT